MIPIIPKSIRSFDIASINIRANSGRQFISLEYKCMGDNSPIGLDALRPRNILALFINPSCEMEVSVTHGCLKMAVPSGCDPMEQQI